MPDFVAFRNPLLPAPSQDPWVMVHEGVFHAMNTDGRRIFLRRSSNVGNLFEQPAVVVWKAPASGPDSKHLWAPELHRLGQHWFIYYAADDGRNRNHRLWALAAGGDDPAGPYHSGGTIQTGGWSIDATVLPGLGGKRFLLWSGWEGADKGAQNLYMAPLADPVTLARPTGAAHATNRTVGATRRRHLRRACGPATRQGDVRGVFGECLLDGTLLPGDAR